jgi:hypothetical protein
MKLIRKCNVCGTSIKIHKYECLGGVQMVRGVCGQCRTEFDGFARPSECKFGEIVKVPNKKE